MGGPARAGTDDTLRRLQAFLQQRSLTLATDHSKADLLIVVGGDGSMLSMAKSAVESRTPVIGVNRGRLGFLTDILPDELETVITEVLAGNYTIENRFLFDVFRYTDSTAATATDNAANSATDKALGSALNDVVIHPASAAQMLELELFVDKEFVYSLEADGLIIATPTGSTAYALSAGGPIMHPRLNATALVPMHPHSLSSRPIVVDGDSEIRLRVAKRSRCNALISCDGEVRHAATIGDEFLIRKKSQPLQLVHPLPHSFYESCRSKLGWGNRQVNSND